MTKSLSNKDSYYSLFPTGNLETLNKPDLINNLRGFFKENYSANIMVLTVYGSNIFE